MEVLPDAGFREKKKKKETMVMPKAAAKAEAICARVDMNAEIQTRALKEVTDRFGDAIASIFANEPESNRDWLTKDVDDADVSAGQILSDTIRPTLHEYMSSAVDDGYDDICFMFGGIGIGNVTEQLGLAVAVLDGASTLLTHVMNMLTSNDEALWPRYRDSVVSRHAHHDGNNIRCDRTILANLDAMLDYMKCGEVKTFFMSPHASSITDAAMALPLVTITQLLSLVYSMHETRKTMNMGAFRGKTRGVCGHSAGMIAAVAMARLITAGSQIPSSCPNHDDDVHHVTVQILAEAVMTALVVGIELSLSCSYESSPMLAVKGIDADELRALVTKALRRPYTNRNRDEMVLPDEEQGDREENTKRTRSLTVAVENSDTSNVVVGDPALLASLRDILNERSGGSGVKSVFLKTDVPFHTHACIDAMEASVQSLRALSIVYPISELRAARVICCSDGKDIRQKAREGNDVLDALVKAITVWTVNWRAVTVICGGALVVDIGPGTISDFGASDVCAEKCFPRREHWCCQFYTDDPIGNPLQVCQHCGRYTRSGAPFSLSHALRAKKRLTDTTKSIFQTYDPFRDVWYDEREHHQKAAGDDDDAASAAELHAAFIQSLLI